MRNLRNRIAARQSGFTLVEIAIVLVIIGLLLVGVLQGQEMIENSKIKNLATSMKGVQAAYYAYQDRYQAVPGDDIAASNRFTGADNGNGNGIISGLYNAVAAPAAAAESNSFWQHTRMAGFLSGTATAAVALPTVHTYGGFLGVEQSASTYGMTGPVVCAGSVPWKVAQAIDAQFDDGNSDTGKIRAGLAGVANLATAAAVSTAYGPTVPATAVIEAGMHTVCMKI